VSYIIDNGKIIKCREQWFRISIGNVAELNLDSIIKTIENSVQKSVSYVNSLAF
jgi:hypothetical protein